MHSHAIKLYYFFACDSLTLGRHKTYVFHGKHREGGEKAAFGRTRLFFLCFMYVIALEPYSYVGHCNNPIMAFISAYQVAVFQERSVYNQHIRE